MPLAPSLALPVADHLCGTYQELQFCLVSGTCPPIRRAIHQARVIACEQYLNRTIIISNIDIYLENLRPDRDSNAGPTA
jgi:hypothetical protein